MIEIERHGLDLVPREYPCGYMTGIAVLEFECIHNTDTEKKNCTATQRKINIKLWKFSYIIIIPKKRNSNSSDIILLYTKKEDTGF
jgi:hypothetical protein